MNHILVAILSLVFASSGTFAAETVPPIVVARHKELAAIIRGVDLKSGINQSQASAIAELYFESFISGCGGADQPVDNGTLWEVTPRIGYEGKPDKNPIIIEKHSGKVSWGQGPSFASLTALLAKAL